MSKVYVIKCYVTRPQFERIKQDALQNKSHTISHYVRDVLVRDTVKIEQMIVENNKILKRVEQHLLGEQK